jgi:hypothetical protein
MTTKLREELSKAGEQILREVPKWMRDMRAQVSVAERTPVQASFPKASSESKKKSK